MISVSLPPEAPQLAQLFGPLHAALAERYAIERELGRGAADPGEVGEAAGFQPPWIRLH